MKNKKTIMNILSKTVDPFMYKILSSKNPSEKELLITILKASDQQQKTSNIMLLLEYMISKIDKDDTFFDQEIRNCLIKRGDYIIMNELLRYRDLNIFSENDLQTIYKDYNNYEIRSLVEAKLWAGQINNNK